MIEVGGGPPHSLRYDWGDKIQDNILEYGNYYDNIIIDQFFKVN